VRPSAQFYEDSFSPYTPLKHAIRISSRDPIDVRDGIAWARVVTDRLAEQVVLLIHQDSGRTEPGSPILIRAETQFRNTVEIVLFTDRIRDARNLRPNSTFVVGYV
jgi:hypothetical protein